MICDFCVTVVWGCCRRFQGLQGYRNVRDAGTMGWSAIWGGIRRCALIRIVCVRSAIWLKNGRGLWRHRSVNIIIISFFVQQVVWKPLSIFGVHHFPKDNNVSVLFVYIFKNSLIVFQMRCNFFLFLLRNCQVNVLQKLTLQLVCFS